VDLRPDPVLERLMQQTATRLGTLPVGCGRQATRAALVELDVFTMAAPEAADGFDLGLGYVAMVCTELGRRALPEILGGVLLVQDGAPDFDPTKAVALAGISDPPVFEDPGPDALCCVWDNETLRLLPESQWRPRSTPAPDGCLVLRTDPAPDAVAITVGGTAAQTLTSRARIRQAAYLQGLAEGAHSLAVAHTSRRRQFDRAVLDNQGVALPLAQTRIQLAAAGLAVRQAAWLADAGEPFALEAVQALALAAETALAVVRQSVQFHGARGLSLEFPIHAYYRPVRIAATRHGSPSALWREAGALRLAAAGAASAGRS
jgi:hypothetical protein